MPGPAMADDGVVNRMFVTAHLLTGGIDLAENAVLEAIDVWKPGIETVEEFFRNGVVVALRKRERRNAPCLSKDKRIHSYLPAELQTVLELRPWSSPAICAALARRIFPGGLRRTARLPPGTR